ncbi:MAG: TonB-dependent receptor [Pseudohongiellaceae bacterium]
MSAGLTQKLLVVSIATAISSGALAQSLVQPKIEEIAVIGQFVPDEKRGTSAVSNVVGSEQFTRSGDANIAESLKRVAGLSTVGGKFVFIRGLGERYSTTLLNGAILPSPEPVNRVVPLDLFPTSILDSVLVQKTYSAQYPSEFGGGVMQLRTKKSTDEFFWNVSSTLGLEDEVNFSNGFSVPGGNRDWAGMDDGTRAIPDPLAQATAGGQELRPFSPFLGVGVPSDELQTIGRSLRNQYNPDFDSLPANYSFQSTLGNFHELGDSGAKINYLAAVNYSNSWDTDRIERNSYKNSSTAEGGLEIEDDLDFIGTEHSVDISAIVTAGLDINENHNIRFTSTTLRKTDDRVNELTGDLAAENIVRINEIEYIERELMSNQLQGDHYFPEFNELVVNWRYSDVTATRDVPDNRRYRYDLLNDEYIFSTRADGNVRRFMGLEDNASDFGLDATMVFYGPANSVITTKAGYVANEKVRDSEIRRYTFFDRGRLAQDQNLLRQDLETIFAPENIAPDGFELRELTRPTDNYFADNESEAFYLEGEVNFDDRLRLMLGARNETFEQRVETFDLFDANQPQIASQESDDILPAFSATFINNEHQFRVAYSETLSRPDFRELSQAAFTDPVTGREVIGNPNLEIASITNYDFRWEWYFGFNDYMSFGLFYKEFELPIESTVQAGPIQQQTFSNAESAENAGAEFEFYKRLDFFGGRWEDFYVQGNVSFIDSTVQIRDQDRGVLTNTSRPLQGQSDWLFNAQVGYEPYSGVTATLLYHYFGERIAEVGTSGAPDLIEQPFGELNFVYIHEFADSWRLNAKLKNIMNERSEIRQGGFITTGFYQGRQASVQLDYTF